jgi:hypothetical protein
MYFSPFPCYPVPLRPKYSPQHPILKHPQPTFLPKCERPSLTPVQNNRQNYTSVYLNLCIFMIVSWKTKDSALFFTRGNCTKSFMFSKSFSFYLIWAQNIVSTEIAMWLYAGASLKVQLNSQKVRSPFTCSVSSIVNDVK